MISSAFRSFILLCLVGTTASVTASEQRVLLSFDNSGHQVRKIVYPQTQPLLQPETSDPAARQSGRVDMQAVIATLEPGIAILIWEDDNGYVQANQEVPDPRITHAPTHITGSNESVLGQNSGAWLVEGPQSATSVTILLPANVSLGLAFEQWDVFLTL